METMETRESPMKPNNLVTYKQWSHLCATLVLPTAVLSLPKISFQEAGNGGWLTPLISGLVGLVALWEIVLLAHLYPGLRWSQMLPRALGPKVGQTINLGYIIFFWSDGLLVICEGLAFIHTVVLPLTPYIAVLLAFCATLTYVLWIGMDSLFRVNALMYGGLWVLGTVMVAAGLLGPFHWGSFSPFLEEGWGGVFQGSYVPMSWYGEMMVLSMFLTHVQPGLLQLRTTVPTWLLSIGLLGVVDVVTMGLFGVAEVSRQMFPTYLVFQYLQLGDFLHRVEILFLIPWTMMIFFKSFIFFAAAVQVLQDFTNSKSPRPFVLPLMGLTACVTLWAFPVSQQLPDFLLYVFPHYALIFEVVIPGLLWMVAQWRQRNTYPRKARFGCVTSEEYGK
ncbi:hypothetical protein D2Q93_05720 [Alicyclobacillaceae bacterium I2511]|nr:hypothetical protein D2Q93_05720 [Alicyclobacillaceae bacterium I2511]